MYNNTIKFNSVDDETLVVLLPGYKGNNNELSFLRDYIVKEMGFSFLCLPYKLTEEGKERPIRKVIKELVKKIKTFFDSHKFKHCYLIGYSLGAALALDIASKKTSNFSGLILISIFDDRKSLLLNRGIKLLRKNNISPIRIIKKVKNLPTLFIHGINDKSIVIERAKKVFKESNKKYSNLYTIPGDHYFNDRRSKLFLNKCVDAFLKKTILSRF